MGSVLRRYGFFPSRISFPLWDVVKQIHPKILITGHGQRVVDRDIPDRLDAFREVIF